MLSILKGYLSEKALGFFLGFWQGPENRQKFRCDGVNGRMRVEIQGRR